MTAEGTTHSAAGRSLPGLALEAGLTQRQTHFEFGENWLSYLEQVSERNVREAISGLERLFPNGELRGRRFLDIGCGSGISLLAALELGAREVVGFDIDENSVEASKHCLRRFAPHAPWRVSQASVLDLSPARHGRYDIVYSWGVLHHTGNLRLALERAASLVSERGLLAIALYRKSPMCGFWQKEKRFYSRAPRWIQVPVRWLYQAVFLTNKMRQGQNPLSFVRDYPKKRGMSWKYDAHDWLGGYPYESSTPEETHAQLASLGFEIVRQWVPEVVSSGLLGVGCDEYVAQSPGASSAVQGVQPQGA
jgi:SAM-dependent methyltransferase